MEASSSATRPAFRVTGPLWLALGTVLAALGDEGAAASEQHLLERLDPERARQLAVDLARRKKASGK